ncbi:MAG: adenylate/guanylate cyclase domain-containing protein, partial [Acidimicrobiia bacterium]
LLTSLSGGLSTSIISPYIAIVPMLAVMLINQKAGFVWFFVVVIEILVLGFAQIAGVQFPLTFDSEVDAAFKLAAFLGLVVIIFFIVRDFDTTAQKALEQVEEEQEKTQNLLLNILPENVAEELKTTGRSRARDFDQVTILFSDFKNFTEISAGMTPQDLVSELNTCFYSFDSIMRSHGLEKIKTIGDAYMAASGLDPNMPVSPGKVIRAALEMQAFLARHGAENLARGKPSFEMRAGIHTGPVVAGVVGDTKFQYDVWGDTVNTASRMETSGEAGEVNISEDTYELVKDEPDLVFTRRGAVGVKGKGDLEMYFVKGRALGETASV